MKKNVRVAVLALIAAPALADSHMKAGLWEMRIVKQVMDGQDMAARMAASQAQMQQMMASMSPAQRKQMEQTMGSRPMSGAANVHRICVSPEMASRDKPAVAPDSQCESTKVERSGNQLRFEMKCPTMTGKGESISHGDSITTRMDAVMTAAGGRHTMQSESQMKYLGPDCQGIKPADQIAREMQGGYQK